jgi:hypothetical protein
MQQDVHQETKEALLQALVQEPADEICSHWLLDRIPVIFNNDTRAYAAWRRQLAHMIQVDASEIRILGSAACGISFNPDKNFTYFNDKSDIDVAVVSEYYFNLSWRTLRSLRLRKLSGTMLYSVNDHIHRLIYWGTIATDKILSILPFAKEWRDALDAMRLSNYTNNRVIKIRIYKDYQSLRGYHVSNIGGLKNIQIQQSQEYVKIS